MRRLAAVFSSKRDKSDSHRSDHSHRPPQPAKKHLKIPLSIGFSSPQVRTPSSITSTPQLSSVSDHGQSSGSSSGSASLSLPTPEDDGQAASLGRNATRRSWRDWLGGKRSEPEPPPVPGLPNSSWDRPVPVWDERPPTLQVSRTRDQVRKETNNIEDDSEESDDEGSFSVSDDPRSPMRSQLTASPERARRNLELLIAKGVNPPLPATPFVQHSPNYLFPRSCNRPRSFPVFDMRRVMFKRRLLNRLERLSADEEKAILPFALKAAPVPPVVPILPSHEATRPPETSHIFAASPGVRRWISRPCFEDRYSILLPSQDGVRRTPIVGTLAVTALEYSEFLDVMVDPDFDPSSPLPGLPQEVDWTPSVQFTQPSQSPPLDAASVNSRPSYLPSPSPLRNQHNSDVSLSESTSQYTILAPNTDMAHTQSSLSGNVLSLTAKRPIIQNSVAAPVKRVVRFVEEDTEDAVPLHLVRQKKKQEEMAKFLRAEQRRRMMKEEQERWRLEAEAMKQERRRLVKERERREKEQKQYAELVASTRFRRESQRAGIIPGSKLDTDGSLLAPSPSTTSLRETERNQPRDPRSSPMHHSGSSSSIPRREASDSALSPSHLYSVETSSYRTGSGGHSPGGSISGHGHQSRPGSMYSSSSEDGRPNSKRYSTTPINLTRLFGDRIASYPMGSGSNHSLHKVPPLPSLPMMPELMNDFDLLPPSAPFMMHQYGRQSRNSSPGRSNSSGSLRGGSATNSSSERLNLHRISSRSKEPSSTSSSPGTSPSFMDARTRTRSGSSDSRRASMPTPAFNRSSTPRSQPSSLPRSHPSMPHPQTVHGIQYQAASSPWTALPTQRGYIPTAMPVSPYSHFMGNNSPSQSSLHDGSRRGRGR
ncbi:hypothetical protein AN958_05529 [Leucoagaricus sp. SymC.cos]|nr:hypothetical protein AN958_05529 [Leucoagaricus sp. SymC.cos]